MVCYISLMYDRWTHTIVPDIDLFSCVFLKGVEGDVQHSARYILDAILEQVERSACSRPVQQKARQ